jgi:DNA primase catalytic core
MQDVFRDRLVFPITHQGKIVGFTARRNPESTKPESIEPKYINTAETAIFHKSACMFGLLAKFPPASTPVIVEGALDAIAVTLASNGSHIGVAPMGTAFTREHAELLRPIKADPVIARDGDPAGQKAALRDFWQLTRTGKNPSYAYLPPGQDPGDLLEEDRQIELQVTLEVARPMVQQIIDTAVFFNHATLEIDRTCLPQAIAALAAAHPDLWEQGVQDLAARLNQPDSAIRASLREAAQRFNTDPERFIDTNLRQLPGLNTNIETLTAGLALKQPRETTPTDATKYAFIPHEPASAHANRQEPDNQPAVPR